MSSNFHCKMQDQSRHLVPVSFFQFQLLLRLVSIHPKTFPISKIHRLIFPNIWSEVSWRQIFITKIWSFLHKNFIGWYIIYLCRNFVRLSWAWSLDALIILTFRSPKKSRFSWKLISSFALTWITELRNVFIVKWLRTCSEFV